MLPGAVTTVATDGLVSVTDGAPVTVTCTAGDVALTPEASVALTVNVCGPLDALFQITLYGAGPLSSPTFVAPSNSSTFASVPLPSVSNAFATTVSSFDTISPSRGLDMPTVGVML